MAFDQFYQVGTTSQMIEIPLRSATTGQLLTGVAFGAVTAKYVREGAASQTTVSMVAGTQGTFASGGWVETGVAGVYQFGIPNAALAAGAKAVTLVFSASGAIDVVKRIVLVVEDLRDALVSSRLAPTNAGRTLDISATGEASANVTMQAGVLIPGPLALESTAQEILTVIGAGSGTGLYTDTITNGSTPLDGVRVQLSTDEAGEHRVYETFTNALGVFVLRPDPGTYYRWLDLAGITFEQGVAVEVEAL